MQKTIKMQLSHSDIMQGIVEKERYMLGGTAYIKTKTGKESWFDQSGHLVHQISKNGEEIREYYDDGTIKSLIKVDQYKILYNDQGLKIHKIRESGIEEFWEYNESGHLSKWYNTNGHERQYICDDSGKVVIWRGNQLLIDWYAKTGRNFDENFDGIIIVNI